MLPCQHDERIMAQVEPTIELLTQLDILHPDILLEHAINPTDYRSGLVFRSAIEVIRGRFAASSTSGRQDIVAAILRQLLAHSFIAEFAASSSGNRYDFTIGIERNPDYFAALEVKGGEGNSINISERPLWAREFGVWCHLDGAIAHSPSHGAHSIVNRITNELLRRQKQVDMVFFKDVLCGTTLRLCPKYAPQEQVNAMIAPDIILFPQRIPTIDDPEPPVHTLSTLRLPSMLLRLFGIDSSTQDKHLWYVHVKLVELPSSKLKREIEIYHQGQIVDHSESRPWSK